jgi:hypothetical protein
MVLLIVDAPNGLGNASPGLAVVRLAWSMQRGRPADQQDVVARRYLD